MSFPSDCASAAGSIPRPEHDDVPGSEGGHDEVLDVLGGDVVSGRGEERVSEPVAEREVAGELERTHRGVCEGNGGLGVARRPHSLSL